MIDLVEHYHIMQQILYIKKLCYMDPCKPDEYNRAIEERYNRRIAFLERAKNAKLKETRQQAKGSGSLKGYREGVIR